MRYKIILSYDGSGFCGWQTQPDAKTVQECLENALSTLLKTDISVTGAGRTDSGVNAVGYVAHFDIDPDEGFDAGLLGYKLNAILPKAVVIHSISAADEDFHARFSAKQRKYTYFLHRTKDPFADIFSYHCPWALDVDAMNRAASLLVGTHDFSCFEKTGTDVKTSICTVSEAFWSPYTPQHASLMGFGTAAGTGAAEPWLYFRISADRFLRNMVRAVVGTLIDVGRGKRSVGDFAALVLPPAERGAEKVCRRSLAGESVPGHALFLSEVDY